MITLEFFKKRSNAVSVFVVVVILFSILGCHRSLSKVCRHAESAFFDETISDSITCPADHLENCVKYANRFLSVISGSEELSQNYDDISTARENLADAMDSGDISDIYDAYTALSETVDTLAYTVDNGTTLPESNDDYSSILSDFQGAQSALERSEYNSYIDEFINSEVRPFPTGILRLISFVRLPDKFE